MESLIEFERCAISNAVPVEFCTKCIQHYVKAMQQFNLLIGTKDDATKRTFCGDHYINQDSLNILLQRYRSAKDLWNSGACTSNLKLHIFNEPNLKNFF